MTKKMMAFIVFGLACMSLHAADAQIDMDVKVAEAAPDLWDLWKLYFETSKDPHNPKALALIEKIERAYREKVKQLAHSQRNGAERLLQDSDDALYHQAIAGELPKKSLGGCWCVGDGQEQLEIHYSAHFAALIAIVYAGEISASDIDIDDVINEISKIFPKDSQYPENYLGPISKAFKAGDYATARNLLKYALVYRLPYLERDVRRHSPPRLSKKVLSFFHEPLPFASDAALNLAKTRFPLAAKQQIQLKSQLRLQKMLKAVMFVCMFLSLPDSYVLGVQGRLLEKSLNLALGLVWLYLPIAACSHWEKCEVHKFIKTIGHEVDRVQPYDHRLLQMAKNFQGPLSPDEKE